MKKTLKIKDLYQISLLADPLKLRLLQSLAEDPKTIGQVAREIGASVTKLYRHVDALHAAGLIEITSEKQKRGTVERTFRAVANRFEADPALFANDTGDDAISGIRDLLRAGEDNILAALARADDECAHEPLVIHLRGKATTARLTALRRSLEEWIASVQADDAQDEEKTETFGAVIAFYVNGDRT
ncbi:MAG TPA: winged helix-turn-helix domain-containing protein [Woeseiaceae bacterium]|nr:winged helix-turn-helix domain-containing protein [Woeseiaceae bacterium]